MTSAPSPVTDLSGPDTPFAVVDIDRTRRNIARLWARADRLGVPLRPHMKTAKSLDVAALLHDGVPGPVTVSTLAEAEAFAAAGHTDITYAVGVAPHKLPRVLALARRGVTLRVLLDSAEQARSVAAAAREAGTAVPAQIEIDCDGHRGGLVPDAPELTVIGRILHDAGCLDGVLTHAGESYSASTEEERRLAARGERDSVVAVTDRLRAAGLPVRTVYGWVLTDGGWMAMSRDRGTAAQAQDQGYGLVADLSGALVPGLVMTAASQEHGTLTMRDGGPPPVLPVGTRLRVLPNHACATAAQHRGYHVVDGSRNTAGAPAVEAYWPRIDGW